VFAFLAPRPSLANIDKNIVRFRPLRLVNRGAGQGCFALKQKQEREESGEGGIAVRVNWAFSERYDQAGAVDDVSRLFMREIGKLGFSYAACLSHVDPLNPPCDAVVMIDYPAIWLAHFSASNYADRDPVFLAARAQALPFQWSDPHFLKRLKRDQIRILDEAAEAGLEDGLTIPLHAPKALPASCSLVIGPDGIDPLSVREAHWHAVYAHERARRINAPQISQHRISLGRREKQILEWVGRGKSDFEISVILSLSEHTIHNTVRHIMAKYDAVARVQAVMRALRDGEIRIDDIAD
jgi:DNA-binding CsgD family transcriptional regulator